MPFARAAALGLVALGLAGCSLPGMARTEILSREPVTVAGQSCTFITRSTETNTVNGIHRYVDGLITCGGQSYECDTDSRDSCAAAVAAVRAPRPEDAG